MNDSHDNIPRHDPPLRRSLRAVREHPATSVGAWVIVFELTLQLLQQLLRMWEAAQ